ncbi:hypothetical protein [Aquiflexum gelatinilyticum]|uniref:DUF4402 domain-containing protein n=1 Tax=Aquiflexum gelatinilyticum TaxID=2961943 RepID=A0A9X2SXF8_9BACT|nr:hypothetical protein [Aquiflexum gelatinilyticum]MCR9013772.1 hypothetical protein [Aquiflexum gelatinilyticum]MCS4433510.1 hypothetical protein [Aquiflexum gelatinilyticum]
MRKLTLFIVFIIGPLAFLQSKAQTAKVEIKATATVLDNLQMVSIRDLDLISPPIIDQKISVSPIFSSYAGLFKIVGSPGTRIKINYLRTEWLEEQNEGLGKILAEYSLSAGYEDNQTQSFLLTPGEAIVTLNTSGILFVWLGSELDVSEATPGLYLSEFVLEFEYI